MTVGSELVAAVPRIPTGVRSFDELTAGGLPRGKVVELYGPENVGKTTLAYRALASAQKLGICWFIDGEGQFDPKWASAQGVQVDRLVVVRPAPAEAVLDALLSAVKRSAVLVVLDSVGSLEPLTALKKDIDHRSPGVVPLLLAETLRRVILLQRESQTCVLLLNQLRELMAIGRPLYSDSLVTPGGRALRHFCHLRVELQRAGFLYKGSSNGRVRVGHVVAMRVTKSKVSRPWVVAKSRFIFGRGFEDG